MELGGWQSKAEEREEEEKRVTQWLAASSRVRSARPQVGMLSPWLLRVHLGVSGAGKGGGNGLQWRPSADTDGATPF